MLEHKFDIFKEMTIGHLNKDDLLQMLSKAGVQYNQYAEMLFDHPHFIPQPGKKNIQLVKTTLSSLNLKESCSFEGFSNQISSLGLELCPLYLAAFLRLEYLDQPEGPHLTIASEKPESDDSYPKGFYLRKKDGIPWLRGYKADGFVDWPKGNEFIFIKSSSSIKTLSHF